MGVNLFQVRSSFSSIRPETKHMNLDVRDKTIVWVVMRRESATAYHLQGIGCATGDKTAEEMAVMMCRDETYFIFPMPLNMALPERAIEIHEAYFPLAK